MWLEGLHVCFSHVWTDLDVCVNQHVWPAETWGTCAGRWSGCIPGAFWPFHPPLTCCYNHLPLLPPETKTVQSWTTPHQRWIRPTGKQETRNLISRMKYKDLYFSSNKLYFKYPHKAGILQSYSDYSYYYVFCKVITVDAVVVDISIACMCSGHVIHISLLLTFLWTVLGLTSVTTTSLSRAHTCICFACTNTDASIPAEAVV